MYHSFMSDYELDQELIKCIKNRDLEQKFSYLWEWASNYYDAYGNKDWRNREDNAEEFFSFLIEHCAWAKKIALISLWCWNGFEEKWLLGKLWAMDNIEVGYFWVDSSKAMLNQAEINLSSQEWLSKTFICADYTSLDFKDKLARLTHDYDMRFFIFLWRTFWNTKQTIVVDSMYNMLRDWDFFRFDVLWREVNSSQSTLSLFKRYYSYTKDSGMKGFLFSSLERLWVSFDDWEFALETFQELGIGASVFRYYFKFNKKTRINFRNEVFHVLPWEKIKLFDVRNYHIANLQHFMEEYEFELVDSKKSDNEIIDGVYKVQFLFKRK